MTEIPSLDEVIAQIKQHLPESPEGAFCRGDVMNALNLNAAKADWLLESWRQGGIITPTGKINRTNAWGDAVRVAAYTFVGREK
mgnify:CR=1 FL=1